MTSVPPPPPPSRPARTSPWLKALFGCAIGCGVLVVLALLAGGAGVWWLVSPGEQTATEGVAGGESVGVIHFGGLNRDPGTLELLTKAMVEMQRAADRASAEGTPEAVRWLQEMGRAQSGSGGLSMWIPRELTVALERAEDGEPAFLVALNLAAFPRLIRTVVRRVARSAEAGGEMARERHRGHEIEIFPEGGALTFAGSTLLFASAPEVMRRALDRLEDGPEPGPMAALLPAGDDERWDVRGALLDHDGTLGDSLGKLFPPAAGDGPPGLEAPPGVEASGGGDGPVVVEAPERLAGGDPDPAGGAGAGEAQSLAAAERAAPAVERAVFGLDVVTGDRIEAEIRLDCASAAGAREWLARLEQALGRFEAEHGRGALAAGVAGTVEGSRLRADVELNGIGAWLERWMAEEMAEPATNGDSR